MKASFTVWLLVVLGALALQASVCAVDLATTGPADRAYAVQVLTRIAGPVLTALSENQLSARMPSHDWEAERKSFAHLEALGRLLAGMAPWLELGPGSSKEGELRARYIGLAVKSIATAVNPTSPEYMNFSEGSQPLVDTAFLAQALVRAPGQLWGNLPAPARSNLVVALKSSRGIKPYESNWLLFSAMVEAALWRFTGECEMAPIETAVAKHLEWYQGDGVYGDGPEFHWDYYNSYVIQPMLLEVLQVCREKKHPLGEKYPLVLERARRYAVIQERLISPEGTFPVMGRSSVYRFAALQTLGLVALRHELPAKFKPAAVRTALTAVIRRMIEAPDTFDRQGWLQPGAVGHQPMLKENYISTGSLYLCSVGLLPLGLPPTDDYWTQPGAPWTQKRIWSGQDTPADHALTEKVR